MVGQTTVEGLCIPFQLSKLRHEELPSWALFYNVSVAGPERRTVTYIEKLTFPPLFPRGMPSPAKHKVL